jgi:hypothetical protein
MQTLVTITSLVHISRLVSVTAKQSSMLSTEDLRDVDRSLLEYLREGRVTPAYARKRLKSEGEEYSRGYVQQRLARFEEHGHVENLLDSGLYDLDNDPEK